jgi:hypothetical protein
MNPQTERAGGSRDIRTAVAMVLVCILFSTAARAFNQEIGYANSYGCDAWYFLGIDLSFPDLYASGRFYQTFRFPALLPWIYLGDVVPYEVLNIVKFVAYFTITSAAFMWFNFRLFGLRVAILVTILFCCSTSFLGVLSHDYLTGAGLAWISLLIGTTVEAGRSRRWRLWSIASGALFGTCLYTHLPTALFIFAIPIFVLALHAGTGPAPSRRLAGYVVGCLIGFALISLVFGLYNMSLGGTFYYVGNQIQIAIRLLNAEANSTTGRLAGFGWLRTESIVAIIATMLLGSALLVRRERLRVVGNPAGASALIGFVTTSLVLGWELSGRVLLQYNVYGPWVYPVIFAAVGGMLSRLEALRRLSDGAFWAIVFVILGLLFSAAVMKRDVSADQFLLEARVACGIAFIVTFVFLAKSRAGVLVLVPLAGLMVFSFPTSYGATPWYTGQGTAKAMTLQAANALRIYRSLNTHKNPVFWVGASTPEVISVPRSFLQCGNFAGSFPDTSVGKRGWENSFPPLKRETLGDGAILVVVATGSGLGQSAAATIGQLGVKSEILGEWPIGAGTLNTSMAVLKLESR